ncbi:hypothetical protein [Mucilaginibacter gotjawali]|uniref:Uncharacterized protein n=2 Tax=Mucilaginibacter gotjawali TaxID=1550579 RepID=A0A839SPB0_9SPHI|nr:hypothetical protein [Mucilaginibacter gotjawali]MBB3059044.1 hypothetical protein [Mucilaginibacter gotjawali]BAU52153.1 hypothetical protein MgSA37_00303 [Mucilaginibacter gotjawali]
MIKVLWLSFLLSFYSLQGEYHVQKVWLFTKTQYNGNVPADRNGKHLQGKTTQLICYLKVSRKNESPVWETAFIDGNQYKVETVQAEQDTITAGTLKNTNMPVIIKTGRKSKITQLILTLRGKIEKPEACSFILTGTLNGKSVYIRSNESVAELTPDLMP